MPQPNPDFIMAVFIAHIGKVMHGPEIAHRAEGRAGGQGFWYP